MRSHLFWTMLQCFSVTTSSLRVVSRLSHHTHALMRVTGEGLSGRADVARAKEILLGRGARGGATAAPFSSSASPYGHELSVARAVVRRVSALARRLQFARGEADISQKEDPTAISSSDEVANPVTVADFTVQALVLQALTNAFPGDRFIAEESSRQLLAAGPRTVAAVVANCEKFFAEQQQQQQQQQHGDGDAGASGSAASRVVGEAGEGGSGTTAAVCAALDLGATGVEGGWSTKGGRTWVLDPIDGTKGFIRGEQYAIALALMDKGAPVLGVLGCPTLRPDDDGLADGIGGGCLFWAERGRGAYTTNLHLDSVEDDNRNDSSDSDKADDSTSVRRIFVDPEADLAKVVRCESVEAAHSAHGDAAAAADALGIAAAPVRMDGMGKCTFISCIR